MITGIVIAGILALCAAAYALTAGSRLVLAVSGAKPADPSRYQQLHNVVEEMAISAGIPKPSVYVIEDPSPNVLVTGVSPNKASDHRDHRAAPDHES